MILLPKNWRKSLNGASAAWVHPRARSLSSLLASTTSWSTTALSSTTTTWRCAQYGWTCVYAASAAWVHPQARSLLSLPKAASRFADVIVVIVFTSFFLRIHHCLQNFNVFSDLHDAVDIKCLRKFPHWHQWLSWKIFNVFNDVGSCDRQNYFLKIFGGINLHCHWSCWCRKKFSFSIDGPQS